MKRCPTCSGAMEAGTLGSLSAEDKPLMLAVQGMPAAKCQKGHAAPIDAEFMVWLIHELKDRAGGLPGGEGKGMLFKKYFCACGRELPSKPEQRQSFPFEMAYQQAPKFSAALELPVYKCAGCGKVQLHSAQDAQKHIAQAVAGLNDAAGFPHSG